MNNLTPKRGRPPRKTTRYEYYRTHSHLTKAEMAEELGITRHNVNNELSRYQLPFAGGGRGVTPERGELIRRNFLKMRYPLLAQLAGVSLSALTHFVSEQGLRKCPNNRRKRVKIAA